MTHINRQLYNNVWSAQETIEFKKDNSVSIGKKVKEEKGLS